MSTTLRPPGTYDGGTYTPPAPQPAVASRALGGVAWYVWAILAAATCVVVGVIWDISWHMTIGRDGLLSPPHLASYAGGAIVGLTCGWLALRTTFAGTAEERARSVRVWGFQAPLGAWVCVWGAFAMLTSAPFDDWWHDAYGLDVEILSPPHTVLAIGMQAIVVGAMLMTAAYQNQVSAGERARNTLPARLNLVGLGYVLTMISIFVYEYSERSAQHGDLFYRISAFVYPVVLVAAVRGSALRWPATTVALVYMGVRAVMLWVLPLFPGQPRLGPVFQPVTHFVPLEFPLLLVAPALAIDWLMRRSGAREAPHPGEGRVRDWVIAVELSVVFLVAFMAVQWPFAEFLMTPWARNPVFATHMFPYMWPGGNAYTEFRFYESDLRLGLAHWARGLAWALLFGTLSARLGLAWGNWMSRVRR